MPLKVDDVLTGEAVAGDSFGVVVGLVRASNLIFHSPGLRFSWLSFGAGQL